MTQGLYVHDHDARVAPNPACCSDPGILCSNCARMALSANAGGMYRGDPGTDEEFETDEWDSHSPERLFDIDEHGPIGDDPLDGPTHGGAFDRTPLALIGKGVPGTGAVPANRVRNSAADEIVYNGADVSPGCLIPPTINFAADREAPVTNHELDYGNAGDPNALVPPTINWQSDRKLCRCHNERHGNGSSGPLIPPSIDWSKS